MTASLSSSLSSEKSTIVRAKGREAGPVEAAPGAGPAEARRPAGVTGWRRALLGAALAVAERAAPRLGARLAIRMWMTVPTAARAGGGVAEQSGDARGRAALPGDAGVRRVLRGGVVAEGGGVVTEAWGAGPPVYLLHGWAGNRGQFAAFVEPLTSAGFSVVAIDAPGHGESGPGQHGRGKATMLDFIAALRAAIASYGPPHAVVGHSFGASAVAVAALDGVRAGRLVLIAPVANAVSGVDIFARAAGVGPRVRAAMPRRIARVTRRPIADFDIAARAAECEDLPKALVIHDTGDKQVPCDNGVLVATAWPEGRLHATSGLGHLRILRDSSVVGLVAGFVAGLGRRLGWA